MTGNRRWIRTIPVGLAALLAVLVVAPANTAVATFTSTDGPVAIADYSGGPTVAVPSPSVINVSAGSETVVSATVTLSGMTHTCPSDLHVLLVAPNGSSVVLLAHTGSCETPTGAITFDDSAALSFTASDGVNAAGTWRPAQSSLNTGGCPWTGSLVSPAPAGPYGSTLASVAGGPASGTWKLYIEDGCGGDSGSMASWSLTLTTSSDAPARAGYCSVAGNTSPRTNSAIVPGTFLDLAAGQPSSDPHFKGALPANYLQGYGITCDTLPGYVKTDQTVGTSGAGDPGPYTYHRKA